MNNAHRLTLVLLLILTTTAVHAQGLPWRIQTIDKRGDTGTISFSKIDAPDTVHAMALGFIGSLNVVDRTTDGGQTWAGSLDHWFIENTKLQDLSYPTPNVAVVVGDTMFRDTGATIFYTHNGGETWQQGWCDSCRYPSGDRTALVYVSMCDSLNGILTGYNLVMARTTDGGKTWRRLPDPTKRFARLLFGIQCLSPRTYFVMVGTGIYRTDDSGTTWALNPIPDNTGRFHFLDSLHGVMAGYHDNEDTTQYARFKHTIALTSDGGKTWRTVFDDTIDVFSDRTDAVAMADTLHGVTGGFGGGWLYTNNGEHWQSGPNLGKAFRINDVTSIAYPHPDKAWAATTTGVILVYSPKLAGVERSPRTTGTRTTLQVYPNPASRTTPFTVSFSLPSTDPVQLSVVNVLGQEVATLYTGPLPSEAYSITHTDPLPCGHYFVRLTVTHRTITVPLVVVQ
ncbi:MAG TPA: YCF48-related protein [Candidatus Kapabacteria bacterium]|nr:YCF48-related protein [Candidatus Kapabacteria bacterium]